MANLQVKEMLKASEYLLTEFGDPDPFSLKTFEALCHLNYIPRQFYATRKNFGEEIPFTEPPTDMMGLVELRFPTKLKDGDYYFGQWYVISLKF